MSKWWRETAERAIKSMAEGALAAIGTGAFVISDVDWRAVVSSALLCGIVSVLFRLKNLGEKDND